jgi:transposase
MLEFLKILKRQNCGKQIAIFLDNCSVHKTNKVKQFAIDNKIEMVFNIAYCPWFNGIEKVWAVMK